MFPSRKLEDEEAKLQVCLRFITISGPLHELEAWKALYRLRPFRYGLPA